MYHTDTKIQKLNEFQSSPKCAILNRKMILIKHQNVSLDKKNLKLKLSIKILISQTIV